LLGWATVAAGVVVGSSTFLRGAAAFFNGEARGLPLFADFFATRN
jgi:hypothetical protein